MMLLLMCHLPIIYRQNSCAFTEQLRKPAGCRISNHFRNLSHRKIRIYQQVFSLAHATLLNIFRDRAAL